MDKGLIILAAELLVIGLPVLLVVYELRQVITVLRALVVVASAAVTNTHTDLADRVSKALSRPAEGIPEEPRPRVHKITFPSSLFPAKE